MSTGEQPGGITPKQVLQANPAPWTSVTYTDGTIRVFDAVGAEVGLLSVLTFAIGLANVAASRRQEATAE